MEFVSEIDWANLAHLAGIFSAALIFELIRRYRTKKKTHKAHPPHKHRPGHKRGGSTKRRLPDLPEDPAEEPLDAVAPGREPGTPGRRSPRSAAPPRKGVRDG